MGQSEVKGQVPVHVKGQTTCAHHKVIELNIYCKQCKDLACIECLSSVHESHTVCGLDAIIPDKKQDIQNFIDKIEKEHLVKIEQCIADIQVSVIENISKFADLSDEIRERNNKLKNELDKLSIQTLSRYQEIKDGNTKLLLAYKEELEKHRIHLHQRVKKYKEVLQSGSHLQVYDTAYETYTPVTLPEKPAVDTLGSSPKTNPVHQLKLALADILVD